MFFKQQSSMLIFLFTGSVLQSLSLPLSGDHTRHMKLHCQAKEHNT
jgi:hypothetical protein